jgi:hypothetical protein
VTQCARTPQAADMPLLNPFCTSSGAEPQSTILPTFSSQTSPLTEDISSARERRLPDPHSSHQEQPTNVPVFDFTAPFQPPEDLFCARHHNPFSRRRPSPLSASHGDPARSKYSPMSQPPPPLPPAVAQLRPTCPLSLSTPMHGGTGTRACVRTAPCGHPVSDREAMRQLVGCIKHA